MTEWKLGLLELLFQLVIDRVGFWKVELYSKFPSSSIATSTRRLGWNMFGNCHMKVLVRHLAFIRLLNDGEVENGALPIDKMREIK